MNKFDIIPGDDFIWNRLDLIKFLVNNQNKDILINTTDEGCCANEIGLYNILDLFQFRSVTIFSNNILEKHKKYKIVGNNFFKFYKIHNPNYKRFQVWNNKNIFGAFYNRPSWHRIGLFAELMDLNSLLNFRFDPFDENSREFFELQKLFEIFPNSAKKFINKMDKLPLRLEETDGFTLGASTKQHTDQLCSFYPNIFIDVVAETFVSGNTFFATEKTIRPMLLKKPFIIMGSKNFLIYLRQLGFKTFYNFWNEDYDGFEGKERYIKIIKLVNDLGNKTDNELNDIYKDMQSILTHNYNLLVHQSYNKEVIEVND